MTGFRSTPVHSIMRHLQDASAPDILLFGSVMMLHQAKEQPLAEMFVYQDPPLAANDA